MSSIIDKLHSVLQSEYLRGNVMLKYEDLVVKAFLAYPEDFCLDGYPEYPDSNKINKEVYGRLRTRGLIRISNKQIELTDLGVNEVLRLDGPENTVSLTRQEKVEHSRMTNLEGFRLFVQNDFDRLIKQDFYYFFKINAGSKKQDKVGAIVVANKYLEIFQAKKSPYNNELKNYSEYLIQCFEL